MPAILEHQRFVVHIDVLGMSALVAKDPELAWGLLSQLVEEVKAFQRRIFGRWPESL